MTLPLLLLNLMSSGDSLVVVLPLSATRLKAENAARLFEECCPLLTATPAVTGGLWSLILSRRETTKGLPYDA